jgi:sigma-B regulation protein RsbU (phosphoserine phosphatase)
MPKPLRFGWTPYVVLALILFLVVNALGRSLLGYSLLGDRLPFFLVVALVTLVFKLLVTPITRRLVWRVRNRLLVTYFLVGVVPITLLVVMGLLSLGVLLGATMSYIAKADLTHELDRLESLALARASSEGTRSLVVEGPLAEVPSWSKPGFKGIIRRGTSFFMVSHTASTGAKRVEVLKSEPFDDAALARLTSGFGAGVVFGLGDVDPEEFDPATSVPMLDSTRVAPGARPRTLRDFGATGLVPLDVYSFDTGATEAFAISLFARPAAVVSQLLSGLGPRLGNIVVVLLQGLAGIFVVVTVIAVGSSLQLTRSLTRTIHDLYTGTKQVQQGNLSQRIPIRTNDQLSDLAGSFNIMTHRIQRLIDEVKDKEKLEAELEIARQVQAQLFPRAVPTLSTLELTGFCNPARKVSGDYYDFIPMESGLTAVALGDISGKGISAALLMASLQSSLRAQLALNTGQVISTAALVERLNRQLYDQTLPEKYATFYCGIYNDSNGHLLYTNAGHLPPMLLRGNNATRLEATGTVVGIFPDSVFGQSEVELQPGDLLAVFTDGITEPEDKNGEQFGENRLLELLIANRDRPLDEITRIVTHSVQNWASDPDNQDDTTMLLARRL